MIDWSDGDLRKFIQGNAANETYATAMAELNRRSEDALTKALVEASRVTAAFTGYLAAFTLVVAWASCLLVAFTFFSDLYGRLVSFAVISVVAVSMAYQLQTDFQAKVKDK